MCIRDSYNDRLVTNATVYWNNRCMVGCSHCRNINTCLLYTSLRDLENGQCLLQDLYGRVGVVQIHPVFEELLHAFDTRPPVQRNEVE